MARNSLSAKMRRAKSQRGQVDKSGKKQTPPEPKIHPSEEFTNALRMIEKQREGLDLSKLKPVRQKGKGGRMRILIESSSPPLATAAV